MQNNLYRFIIIVTLSLCSCRTTPPKQLSSPDIPVVEFQTADIVFRLGRTIESDLIASSGNSATRYSHIGVIIYHNNAPMVMHIEPSPNKDNDTIKVESLHDFFNPNKSLAGCVTRIPNLTDKKRNKIEYNALNMLNSSITFDYNYLLSDSTTMYCTELIEHIFSTIDISLSQGRAHTLPFMQEPIILPSDIAQNPTLITIWRY